MTFSSNSKSLLLIRKETDLKGLIKVLFDSTKPNAIGRNLVENPELEFFGSTFSFISGDSIEKKIDVTECRNKIAKALNIEASSIKLRYLTLSHEITNLSDQTSENDLVIVLNPAVIVSFFNGVTQINANDYCSNSGFSVEYQSSVSSDEVIDKLKGVSQENVNPFDSEDKFFHDACSLKSSDVDATLVDRRNKFYIDPAKECNQPQGLKCSVANFDPQGKIICKCVPSSSTLAELGAAFADTITSSNFRVAKCVNTFLSLKLFHSIGFYSAMSVLIFFYFFIFFSTKLTIRRLRGESLFTYIHNSCLILDRLDYSATKYFELIEKIKTTFIKVKKFSLISQENRASNIIIVENDGRSEQNDGNARKISFDGSSLNSKSEQNEMSVSEEEEATADIVLEDYCKQNNDLMVKVAPTLHDILTLKADESPKNLKVGFFYFFKYYSLRMHAFLNIFFYYDLNMPLHFRLFVLMTNIIVDMFLNAFFYTEKMIDTRAKSDSKVIS